MSETVGVPPGADTVIVRVGEVGIKSERVRYEMQGTLGDNLRAILSDRDVPGQLEHRRNRPLIRTAEPEAAAIAAADAMGVVSTSPALTTAPELDAITDALAAIAPTIYTSGSFAVDARRRGHHPFSSPEIERVGGSAVWNAVEAAGEDDEPATTHGDGSATTHGDGSTIDPVVDLEDPDVTFHVEVDGQEAFIFIDRVDGPGGLPLGSQRPLVALLSGGIDSPVAAYEVMRRGAPVTPVYLDLGPYGGPDHVARAEEAARELASHAPNHLEELVIVDAGQVCTDLAESIEQGRMLILRRFMYRVAAEIAADRGATGIVTGEAIGQKSSQTTQNLSVTDGVTDFPIHRPLLTWDKQRIMDRAEAIGTHSAAEIEAGCNRFAPDQVETRAGRQQIADIEPNWLRDRAAAAAREADLVTLERS